MRQPKNKVCDRRRTKTTTARENCTWRVHARGNDCWRRWRRANQITVYLSSRLDHMHLFVNKVQEEKLVSCLMMQFYYVFKNHNTLMGFSYRKEEIITHEERVVVVRGPRVHSTNALPWTPAVQRPLYLYLVVQFFFFLKSFGNGDRRAYTNTGSSDLPCVPTRGN